MSSDIAIGSVASLPTLGAISKKPSYLIVLEDGSGKGRIIKKFITLDKPELLQGFVQVKGFYSDLDEDEINKKFAELLTMTPKDLICEVLLPWHRISSIRSLVFKQK